jgi:HK97 family phage portal protein
MGILDNFRKAFTKTYEMKEAPRIYLQDSSPFHNRSDNFKSYAQEGYQQNAIVYRCVNEIANGAAAIPFKVYQGDVELVAHPLINLLARPNPLQAGIEYFQALYSFLLLSGNSYAIASEVSGSPQELHILRPDRVEVVPSNTTIPKAYNYKLNGKIVATYEADPVTGKSEVKHFKLWNPLDDYLGLSPLMAASIDVDQHNMIAKHNIALLTNGARPSGAVVFRPKDTTGNSMMLTDGQRKQIQDDLHQRMTGSNNAGRPLLLEGDFDWKEMGMSPRDMDFLQQKHMAAKDIALCFGIPSQLIGIPDSQTYANVQEARLALYEETIIPLAKRIESDLNEWLAPSFGDDISIAYDIDAIPAMTERRRRVYENVTGAVREGIITRNEARERLGFEPIKGGDEVFISANLFPLGGPEIAPADTSKAMSDAKDAYGYDEDDEFYVDEESKAVSDVNTVPTAAMARNAERGLELRAQYRRGGTIIGVTRANQLKDRENLSPSTVKRMNSYFARHEVDKEAQGFRRGEEGWPSAGVVAWLLWGGDEGQTWARTKVKELDLQQGKSTSIAAE